MKAPINLLMIFSVACVLLVTMFVAGLSWLLGQRIEKHLLERDQLLTVSFVQVEALEYLGKLPFEEGYRNPGIKKDILHAILTIPDTVELEMINMAGKVLWSSIPSNIGQKIWTELFRQALSGESVYDVPAKILYVPIVRNQEVIGIFLLHRSHTRLLKQIQTLKNEVQIYITLFGGVLFLIMLGIVFPANRTLRQQHVQSLKTNQALKAAKAELNQTQQQLIQKERLSTIGEICGAVAHGLKNPISSVRSAVQLLALRSLAPEEQHEIIDDILQEVDRLTKRLNDLLNFIRPFNVDLQYVQLQDILQNVIRDVHWKAVEDKIKLEMELKQELESIQVDASLIEEAISIVLSNAMDASSTGDVITCKIELAEDQQVVAIRDQGKGIAEKNMQLIFEQFYTTRSKGFGLGLTLCKKIIELHHGHITIDSNQNQGTTVRLVLPTRTMKKGVHETA